MGLCFDGAEAPHLDGHDFNIVFNQAVVRSRLKEYKLKKLEVECHREQAGRTGKGKFIRGLTLTEIANTFSQDERHQCPRFAVTLPPLLLALTKDERCHINFEDLTFDFFGIDVDAVKGLLHYGASPQQEFNGDTIWVHFLCLVKEYVRPDPKRRLPAIVSSIELLLDHGADPDCSFLCYTSPDLSSLVLSILNLSILNLNTKGPSKRKLEIPSSVSTIIVEEFEGENQLRLQQALQRNRKPWFVRLLFNLGIY